MTAESKPRVEPSASIQRRTICNRDCPDACGIIATIRDGRVTKLRGDPDHPITGGFLCYRTNQFLKRQYSAERLTHPLLRKQGQLTEVSWEEALDHAAQELLRIREQYGPAAIFHYRSGGSLGLLKVLSDYFFELFGPVTIKRGDICSGAGEHAQTLDFGISDSSDPSTLLQSRTILVWGKNLHVSSPHTIPLIQRAKAGGARVVLIDPVVHDGVKLADRYIQPAPGGDFSLAMAVARVLFERGAVDPEIDSYCEGVAEFRGLCFERPVEQWCELADVEPAVAVELAGCLSVGKPCAILVGWGLGRRIHGGSTVRALDALSAISGNIGIAGGGASFYFQRRRAFDTSFVRGLSAAPRSVSEPLFARSLTEMRDPPIRALWVTAGNPVAMLPDSERSAKAIAELEFSVVVDSLLTDTARHATLVLPTTTLLEEDDLLGSYGHHYIGASRPVVEPPAGVKSDLHIIQQLAERLGLGSKLAGTTKEWKARLISKDVAALGIDAETLERRPIRNPIAPKVAFKGRRFPTPDGKMRLIKKAPSTDVPLTPEFPLRLTALSTSRAQSSQWAIDVPRQLTVTIHPDAAPSAAKEGDTCWLETALGRLRVQLKLDPRQRRDVALLPKGGHQSFDACANSLVEGRLTDLGEGGALYDEPARLVMDASP